MEEQEIKDLVIRTIQDQDNSGDFIKRIIVDTPTDDLQVTNKKYVDNADSVISASVVANNSSLVSAINALPVPVLTSKIVRTSTSATSVSSFTISGLALDTDLQYKVILEIVTSASTNIMLRINNDSTGTNYLGRYNRNGATADAVGTGLTVDSGCVGEPAAGRYFGEINFTKHATGQKTYMTWLCYGTSNNASFASHGGGEFILTDNVTSLVFVDTTGSGANWSTIIYKVYKMA